MRVQIIRTCVAIFFLSLIFSVQAPAKKPSFSHHRDFYDTPFSLVISVDTTTGILIKYTRDGSDPLTSPTAVSAPSPVTLTIDPFDTLGRDRAPGVVIRACTVTNGVPDSNSVTHTYLFLDKIELLSPDGIKPGPEWPDPYIPTTQWGPQGMDYGMDPDILHDPRYSDKIKSSLLSIPTISIVTDVKNLFDSTTGIYTNALSDGRDWERPCSMELMNPDGSKGFQINCGLRIRGAWGRTAINLKHSFRVFFRDEYGNGKLKFPMFGDEGVDEFDTFDLRTSQNYSWAFYANGSQRYTELREVFSRDTQRDMGQPYTRSRYYHLYLNGTYWGLYQTQERSEASFGQSYLGGVKEDYDVVKVDVGEILPNMQYTVEATDGTLDAYHQLWAAAVAGFNSDSNYYRIQGKNPDGSRNPAYPVLVDIDNLIDYMLCTIYTGDPDGPTAGGIPNNFYGMRNRNSDRGFVFFRHDAEHSLQEAYQNAVYPVTIGQLAVHFNPRYLHQQLCVHPDYHLRLVDHINRYYFNNGALTVEACRNRVLKRMHEMEDAVIAESARWGDADITASGYFPLPYTKDDAWLPEVNRLLDQIIAVRTDTSLIQMIRAKLYTNCEPPVFDKTSGIVPRGTQLSISAPAGAIYYTLDGNDTRFPSMLANASQTLLVARNAPKRVVVGNSSIITTWKSDIYFNDSTWALCDNSPGGIGYDLGSAYADLISYDIKDQMYNVNTSCFIRIPFELTQAQVSDFNFMKLRVQYNDGFAAYLNNFKNPKSAVASRNAAASMQWNSRADTTHDGTITEVIDISGSLTKLVAGRNLLAVQALNRSVADSNFFISIELIAGNTMKSSGPVSPSAILYANPITIDRSTKVIARALIDGEWSSLKEASFRVAEGYGGLDITEINYHPLPQDTVGEKQFEFIEFKNNGPTLLGMSGLTFAHGVTYTFPAGTSIQPGAYLVLASNDTMFASRYHFAPFGRYTGQMSNDGDTLILATPTGDTLISFAYGTDYPWPNSPDGGGHTLVRRPDHLFQDMNDPTSWWPSDSINGNPGGDDVMTSIGTADEATPLEFRLDQNYPNPFNPSTTISFNLPSRSFVTLKIFDCIGRVVATPIMSEMQPGTHRYEWSPNGLASGIYFYKLQAGSFIQAKKLVFLK